MIDQHHDLFPEIHPSPPQPTPAHPSLPHPTPPHAPPHPPWWCGFLTNRSSYRYQSTHSPAAGHYPDPSFDPGTVSTRRVLSRAVQSYQKFDAAPHPAPCYPRLSQPIPTPGQALVERVSDRSWTPWAVDLCRIQVPGHRFACFRTGTRSFTGRLPPGLCTRVTKPLRTLRGIEPVCSTSKEVDELSFVSPCLGHAGVNFRRWAAKSEVTGFQLEPLPSRIPLGGSRNDFVQF